MLSSSQTLLTGRGCCRGVGVKDGEEGKILDNDKNEDHEDVEGDEEDRDDNDCHHNTATADADGLAGAAKKH